MRPHLQALDPAHLGAYAADRWLEAAGPLASSKARGVIADHVGRVARFGKSGEGDAEEALEALAAVVAWLFVPWLDGEPDPMGALVDSPDGADEDRQALAVALLAARGRIRLAKEGAIAVPELAALTGLDQSHLSRLARQGDLQRVAGGHHSKRYPAPVRGDSARALLREYGVAGI